MKNEGDVKKVVSKTLATQPGCWFFMPPANGYGRAGIPDFLGCVNGHMFAVETKFGKGTTTANQEREIAGLMRNGARVWIVRETTLSSWDVEFKGWAALCS